MVWLIPGKRFSPRSVFTLSICLAFNLFDYNKSCLISFRIVLAIHMEVCSSYSSCWNFDSFGSIRTDIQSNIQRLEQRHGNSFTSKRSSFLALITKIIWGNYTRNKKIVLILSYKLFIPSVLFISWNMRDIIALELS